jgi:hypothetical protein
MRHLTDQARKRSGNSTLYVRGAIVLTLTLMAMGVAVLLVSLFGHVTPVRAFRDDMYAARAYYGITRTVLDSCQLCHNGLPNVNAYGLAYSAAGRNFAAIEMVDSDGDGVSNIEEIRARTFPGDLHSTPLSHTVPVTTPAPQSLVIVNTAIGFSDQTGVVTSNQVVISSGIPRFIGPVYAEGYSDQTGYQSVPGTQFAPLALRQQGMLLPLLTQR